ncbi:4-hydroxy-4-methyl-2-oxoglutarate aldolase [compost metagenome]
MQTLEQRMIDTIRRNRISTSEVSDCLGKTGAISGLRSLNAGHHQVGLARFVYAYNRSNWEFHEQIQDVQSGEILVVEALDCEDYAVFGSLVAKFLFLYRGVAAVAINGLVRDAHTLRKENYAIWSTGTTPIGCFNVRNETLPDVHVLRARYEGALAVCDDSGVVIIPKAHVTEAFLEKLHLIELQEDAWFHSIDTDGFTTYETVCMKKYLEEGSVFHKYQQLKQSL